MWSSYVNDKKKHLEFERVMLPHLGAAYNLALWLLRHPSDAEDAVQDAFIRAYRAIENWSGENASGWILKIVRNTCMTKLKKTSRHANVIHLDSVIDDLERRQETVVLADGEPLADERLIAAAEEKAVREAVRQLPADYREVIVLREFEDLSYRQIALVIGAPVGTVMSRLSRARQQLRLKLSAANNEGHKNEM